MMPNLQRREVLKQPVIRSKENKNLTRSKMELNKCDSDNMTWLLEIVGD